MKTLKKTLCLILAVVMVVGVLILPANAASIKDYKDNEDIKYKEAVEVLSGLGILGGKDTGYFAPKGTLTRAEAAKIIAWMLLGEDAEKLHSNTQIFADVAADNWAAGYIAFCKNEGILAGDGAGNFRPNGELNGVDFGKMLLTALGYDAKLEGYVLNKDWDKNVTTQMLNKNSYIDIGTVLSNPMTREEAAQMAFLALQQSTVKYPATIFGTSQYVLTGTTLGASFGLERVKGVMTANEYADLNSSQPASNGKSVIGGKTYNYASDLTEIGLYYEGWACVQSGTKTIIHLDAVGNTVWENHGVATSLDNFRQVTGMNDASVGYINFGETTFNYIADIRIVYDVDGEGPEDQVIIRANDPISNTQFAEMRDIFDKSQEEGWIAVGTVDVDDTNDLSDTISWSTFRSRYLTTNDRIGVDVTGADQGEWLKVIDNNRDGKADYVFLTTFTMTTVTGVAKNGDLTLDNGTKDGLIIKKYATSADLAVGDVVIYTTIDETTYVEPAPSFTGKVDKYTYKTEVLTVKGEDYPQSEIGGDVVMFNAGYYTENEDAAKNTEYTYYQDFFGNIRAFEEPAAATNSLVLLTDGWYRVTKSNDEYAVRAYLDDEIGVYDVNNRAVGAFIDPTTVTDKNSWGNLKAFKDYNADNYDRYSNASDGKTNLARYSADEDGVLSLSSAKTYIKNGKNKDIKIATDYVELTKEDLKAGQRTYNGNYEKIAADTALVADTGSVKVQATKDTVFYYVWTDTVSGNKVVKSVIAVTGYANAYAVKNQIDGQANILKAYAVARNTNADAGEAPYWVAEAIVIETEYAVVNGANNMVLGYNVLNKTVRDFGDLESVLPTGELGDLEVKTIDGLDPVNYNAINRTGTIPNPAFYLSSGTEGEVDIDSVDENYDSYGIYTALIDRKVALKDYIVTTDGTELSYNENNVIVYHLSMNSKRTANLITHEDSRGDLELEVNEYYILVADARGNIVYAILVDNIAVDNITKTVNKNVDGKGQDVAAELFEDIYKDNQPTGSELALTSLKIKGVDVELNQKTKTGTVTLRYADWSEGSSVDRFTAVTNPSSKIVAYYQADGTTTITANKSALNKNDHSTIIVTVTDGANFVKYSITVNMIDASKDVSIKTITVKGVQATRKADQGSADGTNGNPWVYEVTVPYNSNQNTDIMRVKVVPTDSKAVVQSGITDSNTGMDNTYAAAAASGVALTGSGNFKFSVKAEDPSAPETFYQVNVTLDQSQKVTLAWGTKDNTSSQNPSDGDVPSDKALELTATASTGYIVKGFTYTIADVVTEATSVPVVNGKPTLTTDILKKAEGKTITVNVVTAESVKVKAAAAGAILIEQDGKWVALSTDGVDIEKLDGGSSVRVKVANGKILTAKGGDVQANMTVESEGGFTIWNITAITEETTLTVNS